MNPTDSDAVSPSSIDSEQIRHALASQGVLVGRHEQALKEVIDQLRELSTNVSQIGHHVNQLSTVLASSAAASTSNPSPPATTAQPAVRTRDTPLRASAPREPHIPTPERYYGDLGSCGRFLLQCSLVFDQQSNTYAADKSRISFVLSLLGGKASQWATAVWEANSPICWSYRDFSDEMRKIFDHPVRGKEAAKRLLALHQGASSVAQYAIDFRILAAESGWDDAALQGVFMRGLAENIKDELAARDETESLEELISLAIRLDNRLRERRREKASRQPVSRLPCTPFATLLSHPYLLHHHLCFPILPNLLRLKNPCSWAGPTFR
uniref:Retrotransposon gag domain-containing protein n=1 Tax=Neogobius melanostomus TaxID=47308 RepID=A0A8C6U8R8_9GOBI